MILDLAPTKENPRNSEGAFLTLRDGHIVFVWSRYCGKDAGDGAYAELAAIFSRDGGETFGEARVILRPTDDALDGTNCMSVSLLRLENGDIGMFYLLKHGMRRCEVMFRRMNEKMEPLGMPISVTPNDPGFYVLNNDRVIRMLSGRLLMIVAYHPLAADATSLEYRAVAYAYASDDDGRSWHRQSRLLTLPAGMGITKTGLQEPGLVELMPGVVLAYFRTDMGRQYTCLSVDGGHNWTPPEPSRFISPVSPMLIKQNPEDGVFWAIRNPIPEHDGMKKTKIWTGGRTPLILERGVFGGDGIVWSAPIVLEDDPEGGFCYPALHFLGNGQALLAYCAGSAVIGDSVCLARTRIRKMNLPK